MLIHRLTRCPSCRSESGDDLALGDRVLRRCRSCGLVHASEYADPEEVYRAGYFTDPDGDFGLDVLDEQFQRFLHFAGDARMRWLAEVAAPPGRLLDVGCGSGEVLAAAARAGWEASGVEPIAESAEIARSRGLDVRPTTLEASGLPGRSFDVVSAFHVVEHLTDAQPFIELLVAYTRPGGVVVVEVPNWDAQHRRSRGAAWPHLRPLEHVAHYTPQTLRTLLERAGLHDVRTDTPGFLWPEQHLGHMLEDLALMRLHPHLARFTRPLERTATPGRVPRPALFRLLLAVQRAYRATGRGPVVFATARVP